MSHLNAGISNINTAIIAKENGRFVLHDSQGFEHGEGENLKNVVDVLKDRKDMPNVIRFMLSGMYLAPRSLWKRVMKALRRLCSEYACLKVIVCLSME